MLISRLFAMATSIERDPKAEVLDELRSEALV
jgi:hypothetical protein